MPHKKAADQQSEEDQALEQRVDAMMSLEKPTVSVASSESPVLGPPAVPGAAKPATQPSAKPLDIFKDLKTKPPIELGTTVKPEPVIKIEETAEPTQTVEAAPPLELDDEATDKAIAEIVAHDSDIVLDAQDSKNADSR